MDRSINLVVGNILTAIAKAAKTEEKKTDEELVVLGITLRRLSH